MTSAERIRILRERDGMSQNDLAAKLELSRSSISMYEAGERVPSTYVYQAMADLFNVDLDYIMGRSDKTTVLPERYVGRIEKTPNKYDLLGVSP
jgi:transcriptional regulator with XRE-family HTH domain